VFQHVYRASILSEKMVYDLVRTLKVEHIELEKNAASAIFQASLSGVNILFCGDFAKSLCCISY